MKKAAPKPKPKPAPEVVIQVTPSRGRLSLDELLQAASEQARWTDQDRSQSAQAPSREELGQRLVAMDSLLSNEGWAIFLKYTEWIVNQAEKQMADAQDAHSATKHMGAFYAIRQLITWPVREAEAIRQTLKEPSS